MKHLPSLTTIIKGEERVPFQPPYCHRLCESWCLCALVVRNFHHQDTKMEPGTRKNTLSLNDSRGFSGLRPDSGDRILLIHSLVAFQVQDLEEFRISDHMMLYRVPVFGLFEFLQAVNHTSHAHI